MSQLTDFLDENIKPLCDEFFANHALAYDLSHKDGCGQYTEALVRHLRALGYTKVGLLKKHGGTMYNGHSIDGFLWREGDPTLYRHTDVINSAETDHASAGWSIDDPRYEDVDWMAEPPSSVPQNSVPYTPYQGDSSNAELKRQLAYDYARRPQGADWDVSVWAFRVQHSALMGPIPPNQGGKPLGMTEALIKHRPEWCAALGVPVVPIPASWNIGDPV